LQAGEGILEIYQSAVFGRIAVVIGEFAYRAAAIITLARFAGGYTATLITGRDLFAVWKIINHRTS
jgi:hypothetical protein